MITRLRQSLAKWLVSEVFSSLEAQRLENAQLTLDLERVIGENEQLKRDALLPGLVVALDKESRELREDVKRLWRETRHVDEIAMHTRRILEGVTQEYLTAIYLTLKPNTQEEVYEILMRSKPGKEKLARVYERWGVNAPLETSVFVPKAEMNLTP